MDPDAPATDVTQTLSNQPESPPSRLGLLSHPIISGIIVAILGGGVVAWFFAVRTENAQKHIQRLEFEGLVSRLSTHLSSGDYAHFRVDSSDLISAVEEHRYDDALGFKPGFHDDDSFRVTLDLTSEVLSRYLKGCGSKPVVNAFDASSCDAKASWYIEPSVQELNGLVAGKALKW